MKTQGIDTKHDCTRDDCILNRWQVKTTDSQHEALGIVADALSGYLSSGDWHKNEVSPYTGHSAYVVLSHVQSAILFPDTEIYKGQRN